MMAAVSATTREANVSLSTPLIAYARIRDLLPTLLHPPRSVDPVPCPGLSQLVADGVVSKSVSIRQMRLEGHEPEVGPLHRFRDWPNDQVPKRAAGVYTVWDGDRLVYVGMSGRAMTAEDLEVSSGGRAVPKGLRTRLNAHASGRRSGDQFCAYICDRFVVPALTPSQQQQLAAGSLSLDGLTRRFIHDGLPTGMSSPPMESRRRGCRPRSDEGRCRSDRRI
jgi:hypothetical protein